MIIYVIRCSALLVILSVIGCAPRGLHVIPEHSPYAGKKVLIYKYDIPVSQEHFDLSSIFASKIPYPVIDLNSLGNQLDLFSCIGNEEDRPYALLSKLDVGFVISIGHVSFRRQVVRDVPMVQIIVKGQPPAWDWIFLSLAEADIKVYDVEERRILLQDHYPPNKGQEPGLRVVLDHGPLHNVNTVFTGDDSVVAITKPRDWHYQVADRKAIDKLVEYIVTNTNPSGNGMHVSRTTAGRSDFTCSRTYLDDDIRNLAQIIAEQMNAHSKQVLAIGYIGYDANNAVQAAKVDKILETELHQMQNIVVVPRELSNRIRNTLGLNSSTMGTHPDITVQFGKLSNADGVLYGEVQQTENGMKITTKLYDTNDGSSFAQPEVEIDKDLIIQKILRDYLY